MKISEKFESNFLKAEDLQGRKMHVVIASVGEEKIGDEDHAIAYFRGKQKGLVLNKTNASFLAASLRDETDEWPCHEKVMKDIEQILQDFRNPDPTLLALDLYSLGGSLEDYPGHPNSEKHLERVWLIAD